MKKISVRARSRQGGGRSLHPDHWRDSRRTKSADRRSARFLRRRCTDADRRVTQAANLIGNKGRVTKRHSVRVGFRQLEYFVAVAPAALRSGGREVLCLPACAFCRDCASSRAERHAGNRGHSFAPEPHCPREAVGVWAMTLLPNACGARPRCAPVRSGITGTLRMGSLPPRRHRVFGDSPRTFGDIRWRRCRSFPD